MRVIPSAVMALTTSLVLCAFAIKANADPVQTAAARTVAFLGVQLQNDNEGLEPTTDAERARMKEIERLFESKLQGAGRFKFVPVPPEMIKDIAAGRGLRLFEMRASSERPLRRHDTLGGALCPRQSNTSTTAG